jgi:hypothetical protein
MYHCILHIAYKLYSRYFPRMKRTVDNIFVYGLPNEKIIYLRSHQYEYVAFQDETDVLRIMIETFNARVIWGRLLLKILTVNTVSCILHSTRCYVRDNALLTFVY